MAEMAVQGLLEFWPCKSVNKLISGCLYTVYIIHVTKVVEGGTLDDFARHYIIIKMYQSGMYK